MKIPRFMIAHNVAADPDGLYVIHTQHPRFIGRVFPMSGEIMQIDEIMMKHDLRLGCRTNRLPSGEYYIMGVVMLIDNIDASVMPKLMSRTGDWLFYYFKSLQK